MSASFFERIRVSLGSVDKSRVSRYFTRLACLLALLAAVGLAGVLGVRYYVTNLKPRQQREAIIERVNLLASTINPISGDVLILGEKYGASFQDIVKKEGLIPIEEADIQRGIMVWGKKDRSWLKYALYFNDQGKLIGGKSRDYSFAEIANFIVGRWGKGMPFYPYNNYDVYVNENNGRIYLMVKWHEDAERQGASELKNKATLIMVEKSSAVRLLNYLFERNLLL